MWDLSHNINFFHPFLLQNFFRPPLLHRRGLRFSHPSNRGFFPPWFARKFQMKMIGLWEDKSNFSRSDPSNKYLALEGSSYRMQHPWVGIVNRSQADINKNVIMIAARRREREYFAFSPDYGHLANELGSLCPQGRSIGEYQALKRFPSLQSTIAATANEALERFQENSKKTVIRLVDMESSYLNVDFFRRFPQEVDKVGSVAGANAAAATNVDGYAEGKEVKQCLLNHFYMQIGKKKGKQISELLDEDPTLMERRLQWAKRLELTRKNGVKLILYHGQDDDKGVRCMLETSAASSLNRNVRYRRFPALVNLPMRGSLCPQGRSIGECQSTIAATANEALERFQENSKKTVIRLVDMESSYLNADFFRRFPQEVEKAGNVAGANAGAATNVDSYAEGHFWRIGSNVSSYINTVSETLKNTIPKAVAYCQVKEAKQCLLNHFYKQIGKKKRSAAGSLNHKQPPPNPKSLALLQGLAQSGSPEDDDNSEDGNPEERVGNQVLSDDEKSFYLLMKTRNVGNVRRRLSVSDGQIPMVGTTDLQISLTTQFSERRQIFLWIASFASFAVKVPMVPVHIWLPETHVEAPTAGSIILAGIPLKLGTYGFLRFSIPMFPEATLCSTPFIYSSIAIAIIYTSSTTLRQIDLKKIIAYSSVAHMNLVTIGMFSRAAAVRLPILSYGHIRPKHVCPGMRPINLLAMGEKT
ncbi:hypothetical protein ACH5RR_023668 [Cinchona calisaya]|uniref:NADH-ubiquinone oxidoreductase chain 4 n=1 Tax=Cinchona calisaya TaxID=153742 RepID=A0ABD2ZBB9_9GENT